MQAMFAIQLDVIEIEFGRFNLQRIFFVQVAQTLKSG